ncbi:hypothetical protein FH972_026150 [Carpinus fangiana]|uniref:Uncharacterized protein n=1 Tax=Carpinus fangiana TaxID=176857 RepID=A0A5N6L339_9ROSI|nr:hypothetical protein FH972_026150 [Carpinus fangiana]
MYLYGATLDKLATLPEESAYRQSVEALTKHRLSIVEKQKPAGYDEWHKRVAEQIKSNPEIFGPSGDAVEAIANKQRYVIQSRTEAPDEREVEWDGDMAGERTEGPKAVADRVNQAQEFGAGRSVDEIRQTSVVIEEEPALTKDQITDIENQIGAGLIEEVVIVAERELALIDKMKEAAVWEELAEKPVEGQWSYFERGPLSPSNGSSFLLPECVIESDGPGSLLSPSSLDCFTMTSTYQSQTLMNEIESGGLGLLA